MDVLQTAASRQMPPGPVAAVAVVAGGPVYARVRGRVHFMQRPNGVSVEADIRGLPPTPTGFFAFHLHEGPCGPSGNDPMAYFPQSGGHFNPQSQTHPLHAGDFPPLLRAAGGVAYLCFLTSRFTLAQVIGRSVVIHLGPDDFKTQPSGDPGPKIACGLIRAQGGF